MKIIKSKKIHLSYKEIKAILWKAVGEGYATQPKFHIIGYFQGEHGESSDVMDKLEVTITFDTHVDEMDIK